MSPPSVVSITTGTNRAQKASSPFLLESQALFKSLQLASLPTS